jgi:SAM-dependent methyltransferase
VGCGPGHIGAYLARAGLDVCGVDLSGELVARARRLYPDLTFAQGDMRSLDVEDCSWAGIAAFYAIIHLLREDVPRALAELARVLEPGGWLLLAFHLGEGHVYVEEMLGEPVPMYATLFEADEMRVMLAAAGFDVVESRQRPPYDFEYPSERAYILSTSSR